MYARSTTIQAQPASIDAGITHIRDVFMPALEGIEGCVGLSLLVDRESGRCIATTAWDSPEVMCASVEQVAPFRGQAAAAFAGSATVNDWDIALMHREHRAGEGACARATWLKVVPTQIRYSLDFYRMFVFPELEDLDGFCSASLMVDYPECRRVVSCVAFDSLDQMAQNRDRATELRSRRARDLGAEILDVAEFELSIAHLRVPELV